MKSFFSLLKITLINELSTNLRSKKNNNKRKMSPIVFMSILFIILFIFMSFYMFSIAIICRYAQYTQAVLSIGITFGTLVCAITTITRSYGVLFQSKDFDLLVSMPIKPHWIVANKLVSLMVMNYIYFGVFYIPSALSYGILAHPPFYFYFLALIIFIVGPLLVATVCGMFAYVFGLLLSKTKHKSIFASIASILLLLAIFAGSAYASNRMQHMDSEEEMRVFATQLESIMQNIYYPTKFASLGLQGHMGYFFLFLGISIVPFILYILFVGKFFVKANSRSKISHTQAHYKLKEQATNKPIISLFKKEVKRFFGSTTYSMNVLIGPILSIIIFLMMFFTNGLDASLEAGELNEMAALIFIGPITYMMGFYPSTSCSISLEGKNMWLIKTAPLKTKDIFIAKMLLYIVICLPFILVDCILFSVLTSFNILSKVMFFICSPIFAVLYAAEGLWTNTISPKFNWDNEVQVIKQGTALISMLVTAGITAMIYIPSIVLSFVFPNLCIVFVTIFGVIAMMIALILLFTDGMKRFEKISL